MTAAELATGLKGDALATDVLPKLRASDPDYPTSKAEVLLMEKELNGTKHVPQPAP